MPYKDKEKARESARKGAKRKYEKHLKLGLCVRCDNPIAEGHTLCQRHLSYHAKVCRDRSNKHKQMGLCVRCNEPAIKGLIYCPFHLSKNTQELKVYYSKPINRLNNLLQQKKRKDILKSENKCVGCGMPLSEESRVGIYCVTCADRQKSYK